MRAYIGLGSNLGDRNKALVAAIDGLKQRGARIVLGSRLYETEPVGGPPQPDYLNQVIAIDRPGEPRALLEACLDIEVALGRDRAREVRFGPRTIDLDILAIEGVTIDEPDLIVPHPRMTERAFVLEPLAEITPDLVIHGKTVAEWLAALPAESRAGVRVWP